MKNKHPGTWITPAAGMKMQKGQSMVELSIAFIVLLMLLAGVIDMGRAFFTYSALQDAAQEGAAYASLNPPSSASDTADLNAIVLRVKGNAGPTSRNPIDFNNDPNIGIVTTPIDGWSLACRGHGIKVTVSYTGYPLLMPIWKMWISSGTINLRASATDVILNPACP